MFLFRPNKAITLEGVVQQPDLEEAAEYDHVIRKLRGYRAEQYPKKSFEVRYEPSKGENIPEDEIKRRSGILTIGFNEAYLDNSCNLIDYFCIYKFDGAEGPTQRTQGHLGPDVIASYKHTADDYIHQLAFNLTDLEGNTATLGIAILVDSLGQALDAGTEKKYLIFEGFTAPQWFLNLQVKGNGNKSIYDLVADAILDYGQKKSRGLFINTSHSANRRQHTNLKFIKWLADKYGIKYDSRYQLLLDENRAIKITTGEEHTFTYTHYLHKPKAWGLNNIHYMHTWRNYKENVQEDREAVRRAVEDRLRKNPSLRRKILRDLESRVDHKEGKFPRAWTQCSGLAQGFEIELFSPTEERKYERSYRKGYIAASIPLIAFILWSGGLKKKIPETIEAGKNYLWEHAAIYPAEQTINHISLDDAMKNIRETLRSQCEPPISHRSSSLRDGGYFDGREVICDPHETNSGQKSLFKPQKLKAANFMFHPLIASSRVVTEGFSAQLEEIEYVKGLLPTFTRYGAVVLKMRNGSKQVALIEKDIIPAFVQNLSGIIRKTNEADKNYVTYTGKILPPNSWTIDGVTDMFYYPVHLFYNGSLRTKIKQDIVTMFVPTNHATLELYDGDCPIRQTTPLPPRVDKLSIIINPSEISTLEARIYPFRNPHIQVSIREDIYYEEDKQTLSPAHWERKVCTADFLITSRHENSKNYNDEQAKRFVDILRTMREY